MANVRVRATQVGFRLGRRYRVGKEFVMPERETYKLKKDGTRVPLSWIVVLGPADAPKANEKPDGVQDVYAGSSEDAKRRAEEAARAKLEELKKSAQESEARAEPKGAAQGSEAPADADIDGLV